MAKKYAKTSADPIGEPAAPRSNSAVVREILNSGVEKPSEIARIALEKYELNISAGLINAAKMAWKKKSGAAAAPKLNKTPKKKGRKPKVVVPADSVQEQRVGNGRPTELDVAKFALKMGGVDAAIAALKDLVK